MSKVLRTSAVVVAAVLAVPLWAVPAHAELAKEPATVGGYFFRGGLADTGTQLGKPPNVTGDRADGVAKGNLAVAAQGGQEDKVSFLLFSLASAPLEGTIDSAVLSVPLVPNAPPENVVFNAAPENVRVCKAGDQGFFGEDGESIVVAPDRLCDEFASEPGKLSADGKSYEFDIVGLASTWLEGANDGLALTVAEGAESSPFQVVFAPAAQAMLAYSFTSTEEVFDVAPLPDTTFDSGSTTLDSGFTTPDTSFDGGTTFDAPLVDTALPEPAPVEQAAPEPAVAAPVQNVAAITEASLTPSTGFWAGLLALAGIAALLSLIMGDSRVAAPASLAKQTRLTKALQGRQGGSSLSSGPRLARPVTL